MARRWKATTANWIVAIASCGLLSGNAVSGQTQPSDAPPTVKAEDRLSEKQLRIADKYSRLEKLLFDLASIEAQENPRRAAVLREAFRQSTDGQTTVQLAAIAELLQRQQYAKALSDQERIKRDLESILQLLLRENRQDRVQDRQKQLREQIREIERLIRLETGLKSRTENGSDEQKLAKDQGNLADRTAKLTKDVAESQKKESDSNDGEPNDGEPNDGEPNDGEPNDGEPKDGEPKDGEPKDGEPNDGEPKDGEPKDGEPKDSEPKDSEPKDSEPKDSEPKDGEPKDGEPKDGEPKDGEPKDGEPKDGEPKDGEPKDGEPKDGEPQDGEPQDGEPQDGEPQDGEPQDGESGEQQQQKKEEQPQSKLERAEQKMREAQRKLEEAKRDEAAKAQEEAKEELIKAKAELEEILRQLREEEIARTLALLESRFRKMWEAQVQVYETTMRLDQIPDSDRGREFAIRSNNLSGDQRKILVEADKALLLLREEGSSIAFTESVEQIRDEMEYVSERLANVKVDFLTQESEEEIIATLEEMIEALQQAQKELEDSDSKPPPPGPPPPPGEDPLVDQLAELRMIRSLQKRVYTRTKRYARMLKSELDEVGQAETDDLVKALFNLSRREDRIREIVRDIHLGRNK